MRGLEWKEPQQIQLSSQLRCYSFITQILFLVTVRGTENEQSITLAMNKYFPVKLKEKSRPRRRRGVDTEKSTGKI